MKKIEALTISDASEHAVELMADAYGEGNFTEDPETGAFCFPQLDLYIHIAHPSACCNTYFTHNVVQNFVTPLRKLVAGHFHVGSQPESGVDFYRWSTQTFPYDVYTAMFSRQNLDCVRQFRITAPRITQQAMQLAQWDDGWAANKMSWCFEGPLTDDSRMALEGATGLHGNYARKLLSPMAQAHDALANDDFETAERAVMLTPDHIDWAIAARKYLQFLKEVRKNADTDS